MRVALRRAGNSWLATTTICVAASMASSTAGRTARTIEHDEAIHGRREIEQAPHPRRPQRRPSPRADWTPAGRRPPAWPRSDPADRFHRAGRCSRAHRRPRTAGRRRETPRRRRRPDADRSSSVGSLATSVIDVARLTATVVLPTPPLAPRIANIFPDAGRGRRPRDAPNRGDQIVMNERLDHPLVDAHAHRFEQIGRVKRARDDDEARVRKLPPDGGDFARQPSQRSNVDDDRVRATLPACSDIGRVDRRRPVSGARADRRARSDRANRSTTHSARNYLTNATLTTKLSPGMPPMPAFGLRWICRDVTHTSLPCIPSMKKPSTFTMLMRGSAAGAAASKASGS